MPGEGTGTARRGIDQAELTRHNSQQSLDTQVSGSGHEAAI